MWNAQKITQIQNDFNQWSVGHVPFDSKIHASKSISRCSNRFQSFSIFFMFCTRFYFRSKFLNTLTALFIIIFCDQFYSTFSFILEMIPSNYMIPFWLWIDVHFMNAIPKIDFIPNKNGRKLRELPFLHTYTDWHIYICFIIIWNKNVVLLSKCGCRFQ